MVEPYRRSPLLERFDAIAREVTTLQTRVCSGTPNAWAMRGRVQPKGGNNALARPTPSRLRQRIRLCSLFAVTEDFPSIPPRQPTRAARTG
jgi:hypothetical protein